MTLPYSELLSVIRSRLTCPYDGAAFGDVPVVDKSSLDARGTPG
jgi:hypothetical protein